MYFDTIFDIGPNIGNAATTDQICALSQHMPMVAPPNHAQPYAPGRAGHVIQRGLRHRPQGMRQGNQSCLRVVNMLDHLLCGGPMHGGGCGAAHGGEGAAAPYFLLYILFFGT